VPETEFGSLTMLKLPTDPFVSLELVHDPEAGPISPGGLNHLVIQVEDMHETVTRLAAAGIEASAPSSPDGSEDFWTAWLTDPDDYRIELVQWPPGHPDGMTGADFSGRAPEPRVARRMFELVEPIGVIPYSSDEPKRGDVRPGVHQLLGHLLRRPGSPARQLCACGGRSRALLQLRPG
jgi:lactoylglutathione lyase